MTSSLAWLVLLMLWSILCWTAGQKWLLLFLGNVLRETGSQIQLLGFRYASYEVTIPRKLMPRYGQQRPQEVSYLLQIEGKGHLVHLRQKKDFVPKHFPVFTYSKKGHLEVDYPFIKDDCFYHGFVQDQDFSTVALSTCSGGLRGLLSFSNKTYEIEPVQASATFQHVVYHLKGKEAGAIHMRCGLTEEEQRRQEAIIQKTENVAAKMVSKGNWWTHTRYVKVAIVVEHQRYIKFDRNETLVTIHVLDVVHLANSFYDPLGVLVTVAGLEIWSEKNHIVIADDIETLLDTFSIWRRNTLVKRLENDAGHLFVYKRFGIPLGLAYVGTICRTDWASAVESFMTSSLFFFANTFAHELGHILGMKHDEKYCHCGKKACIMDAYQANTDKFSNCSYQEYFAKRNTACLLIPPDPDKMHQFKNCGNKVVENGEQCDCGSKAECDLDPCCQSNCTMHLGATCALGQCCAKCQYLPARSICREKTSICDLPEYCNGTSEWCPEDVYVQDGAPCSDGAYCYHGNCTTHSGQCKMIFGKKATIASKTCFREMNAQGDRFGNCGLRHGHYDKCNTENILCGRIQCDNVHSLPSLEEHNTVVQTDIGNKQCWGTDYHSGMEKVVADIGAVRDGTPCGTEKMCIAGECMNVSLLKYDCDVTKCHNRGICNTHKHCHCDYGWAPPDCLNRGYGGSIDSGPPPPQEGNNIAVAIIGILFFLFAVGFCLCVYFRYGLMQRLRRLRERSHPLESKQEGIPE